MDKIYKSFTILPNIWHLLDGNELKLFVTMLNQWNLMKNEDGWYFRSLTELADDTCMSRRNVCYKLKSLKEKGIIVSKPNGNAGMNNFYKINVKKINEIIKKEVVQKLHPDTENDDVAECKNCTPVVQNLPFGSAKIAHKDNIKENNNKKSNIEDGPSNVTGNDVEKPSRKRIDKKREVKEINITEENICRTNYWEGIVDKFRWIKKESNLKALEEMTGVLVCDSKDLRELSSRLIELVKNDQSVTDDCVGYITTLIETELSNKLK